MSMIRDSLRLTAGSIPGRLKQEEFQLLARIVIPASETSEQACRRQDASEKKAFLTAPSATFCYLAD
ncbi:hypothetical protein [Paracoccus sp. SSK6]|uniref:hypothetical protein n=1 Tax=Paracoccus sp. SSK6 TaxID=3143131 RepID=UPI00321B11CC